jgi:hypothetical protein
MLMSDALKRIEEYVQAFRDGVARCAAASEFNRADWLDAQNRLARLRDRYRAEQKQLTPLERSALSRVFDDDVFIQGMINARQLGEHVTRARPPFTIRTVDNVPIELHYETSAMSYFAAERVTVPDATGQSHDINHLEHFREAEKRIEAAIQRARAAPR